MTQNVHDDITDPPLWRQSTPSANSSEDEDLAADEQRHLGCMKYLTIQPHACMRKRVYAWPGLDLYAYANKESWFICRIAVCALAKSTELKESFTYS